MLLITQQHFLCGFPQLKNDSSHKDPFISIEFMNICTFISLKNIYNVVTKCIKK